MKRFLLSLIAVLLFAIAPAKAKLPDVDKVAHFSTAYAACDLLYKSMEFGHYLLNEKQKKEFGKLHIGHRIMVVALVNAAGHVKETNDAHYDKGDIQANALGSALWLLQAQIRF